MVISSCEVGTWNYKGYILRSADGVHWRWERPMPNGVDHGMHDRCTALRGPDPEFPYVLLSRGNEDAKRWGWCAAPTAWRSTPAPRTDRRAAC